MSRQTSAFRQVTHVLIMPKQHSPNLARYHSRPHTKEEKKRQKRERERKGEREKDVFKTEQNAKRKRKATLEDNPKVLG